MQATLPAADGAGEATSAHGYLAPASAGPAGGHGTADVWAENCCSTGSATLANPAFTMDSDGWFCDGGGGEEKRQGGAGVRQQAVLQRPRRGRAASSSDTP